MPTPPTSPKDLTALLARSRLLPADAVPIVSAQAPNTGRDADDLEAFRRVLVAHRHLTEYQAALLMRGHSEGFFLGEYKILELLAKGRMAGVYKAAHASGQIVAIKVLPSSKARDPETLARFHREAKLLTRLEHPNVVRSFQIGEADGRHYLVLEFSTATPWKKSWRSGKRSRRPRPCALSIRRCSDSSTSTNGG